MTRAIVATLPGRMEAATHDRAKRKRDRQHGGL